MTVWFTSDTHFYHKNVIRYCHRPCEEGDVETMNKLLVERWNLRVKQEDEVYHLGDFAFCGTANAISILKQLKGKKYWIRGNHDHSLCKKEAIIPYFEWVRDYYMLRVHDNYQKEDEDGAFVQYHQPIVLCHFPILSWDGMAHGSWHLHGHCHGSLPETKMKRKDVGVDTNNLYPYSYEEIKDIMVMRGIVPVDNHGVDHGNY